ncbi:DUF1840 family protein [Lampropedia cohaerens]|nr:DUF1840 family protein [Lampropedia cohaerens]
MYRFIARSSAPIQYFEADAKRLLKIIGKDATAPGIITQQQLAGAITAIEAAIAQEEQAREEARQAAAEGGAPAAHAETAHDSTQDDEPVALRHRALPLLQLLRAAQQAQEDVIWESR